ncbi:MAG: LysR substrate-binding domain-containing protein [Asticcacaulis sp.]
MLDLDTLTLRCVVAIAETGSFTQAAVRIGRSQSALSLQVQKLETRLGVSLFNRDGRRVRPTEAGEIFVSHAQKMLQIQNDLISLLKEPDITGEIRLGTPEDFATHYLPRVLARFRQDHPRVQLNVACDLTLNLIEGFRQDAYDIVLIKQDPRALVGGQMVWREALVWAAAERLQPETPLPLVLSPQPCIYRARALEALDKAGMPWRISYTSPSLAGTIAAVQAGLGISILPANMLPSGIAPCRQDLGLPALADAEIALLKRDSLSRPADMLASHIIQSLEHPRGS